ncbi:MAG: hypothetical protein ACYTEL_17105 [Planctomycetota bacterium]
MNTLTKVMVLLLTLASIFLCGIVATYVANADNYRLMYERERTRAQSAAAQQQAANEELQRAKDAFQLAEEELGKEIESLETQIGTLKNDLQVVKRERIELERERNSATKLAEGVQKTKGHLEEMLKEKLAELKESLAQQTTLDKNLDETTRELIAKVAIIDTLEAEKRRLEEEMHQLRGELDRLLRGVGRETATVPTVTPEIAVVRPQPVPRLAKPIGLKGTITGIDLRNSVAEVSLGTAHGVKQGMKFFVIRGETFICELLIIHVEPERAVGILERVRPGVQPGIGDGVQTNL